MRLTDLLCGEVGGISDGAALAEASVSGLTSDSRRVRPGFLFAALPGSQADGRHFIPEAIGRGAVAVLAPPGTGLHPPSQPVRLLTVDNPRRLFAQMAARFYRRQPATIAAVTGTNGKTSVVSFTRQLWVHLGRNAASLGTLGIVAPGLDVPGSLTTPDPVELHTSLADLSDRGVDRLALEASSHGLSQYRLDGVRVSAAAFTNLSRDHLDYHGSVSAYLAAKLRLFEEVMATNGVAAVNADAEHAQAFIEVSQARGHRILTFGRKGNDLRLKKLDPLPDGQRMQFEAFGTAHSVMLPLVGDFQASNALCAMTLLMGCGEDADAVVEGLEKLKGVPGRLEKVASHPDGAPIFVDYAHTPDALSNVLRTLRPHVSGTLTVVFGCGGDRDQGKRPQMGRTAHEMADRVIVTDDNPRTEDPKAIRDQIIAACPGAREISDRAVAISTAVRELQPNDLLVVAGKGHETGQIIGGEVIPFEDAEAVRAAIREIGA